MAVNRVNSSYLLPFKPHCAQSCAYAKPTYCVLFHGEPAGTSVEKWEPIYSLGAHLGSYSGLILPCAMCAETGGTDYK